MANSRPRIAFLPAHPSQLWMLRPVAEAVRAFADPVWVLRDKDCTLALADAFGLSYTVLSRAATGLIGNARELAANIFRARKLTRALGIDVWVTKYGAANMAARLTRRRSISFNDDDADVVPLVAKTSYPFADAVLVPTVTRMGRYEARAVRYRGCHELFYLHPARFAPEDSIRAELGVSGEASFGLVRLSSLQAHHDVGIRGVSEVLLQDVLELAKAHGVRVFISSEKPLSAALEPYRLPIPAARIHHALAAAAFFLGDSQTMTAEAAVLGTPALRLSSFVGRISYIEDLQRYGLAFGFQPGEEAALLVRLRELLTMAGRQEAFAERRAKLLAEKVDPVPFFARVLQAVCDGATLADLKPLSAVPETDEPR